MPGWPGCLGLKYQRGREGGGRHTLLLSCVYDTHPCTIYFESTREKERRGGILYICHFFCDPHPLYILYTIFMSKSLIGMLKVINYIYYIAWLVWLSGAEVPERRREGGAYFTFVLFVFAIPNHCIS